MFKVDDYVVYSTVGVCRIIDIRKEKHVCSNETEYYILQPAYDKSITIKTPTNNSRVLMRKVITQDDALALIATMSKGKTVWMHNCKQRSEFFKAALRTGRSEELLKIIKMVYLEEKVRTAAGKKVLKVDSDIMKIAEKQLYEEFAIALNLSPDEVVPYIVARIS
jgi:Transcriptional regulators, similar to M. xanthus CarD